MGVSSLHLFLVAAVLIVVTTVSVLYCFFLTRFTPSFLGCRCYWLKNCGLLLTILLLFIT